MNYLICSHYSRSFFEMLFPGFELQIGLDANAEFVYLKVGSGVYTLHIDKY